MIVHWGGSWTVLCSQKAPLVGVTPMELRIPSSIESFLELMMASMWFSGTFPDSQFSDWDLLSCKHGDSFNQYPGTISFLSRRWMKHDDKMGSAQDITAEFFAWAEKVTKAVTSENRIFWLAWIKILIKYYDLVVGGRRWSCACRKVVFLLRSFLWLSPGPFKSVWWSVVF